MTLWQDVSHAARVLRRNPTLVVVAVVSLALGIGINALVFSAARALVLRPLPIVDADRVVFIQPREGDDININFSYPNYMDLRDGVREVVNLAAYRVAEAAIDAGAGARSSWGYLATGNYFDMLGVRPAAGRFFAATEDVGRNAARFIVLSHDYWSSAFNGDGQVVGRVVRVNGQPYSVVGVAPAGFHGTEVFFRPDYWVPMTMAQELEGANWIESRTARNVFVAGRLGAETTQEQAKAALTTMVARLRVEHPDANRELQGVTLTRIGLFGDLLRIPARAFMSATLLLALLVLLAVCTNLASLLAARVVDRHRELAVRLSLGGTRSQLARQLFVEALMLSIAGGVAGMLLASLILDTLTRWRPAVGFPFALDVSPDPQVMAFSAAISLSAAFLAVTAAARRAWRTSPSSLMRGASASTGTGRWSARDMLLGVQVASCCVLMVGSLVGLQGLRNTLATPLGFNADNVLVASFDLNQAGYDRDRGLAARARITDAVTGLPGIDGVTFTTSIPLTTDQSTDDIAIDGAVPDGPSIRSSSFTVPPGYFRVMQTPLLAGRDFSPSDGRVVIINETLARRVFGTADVIGRGLRRAPGQPPIEVIGIAADGTYAMPGEAPRPAVFWPANQLYRSSTQLLVRSTLPQDQVAALVRQAITRLDPTLPVTVQGSLHDATSLAFLPAKAAAISLGAFGVLAVILAITGVYGLAAYSVNARTREIGIRVAVGGRSAQIVRAVLGRCGIVLVAGASVGTLLAVAAGPLLSMVVYQATSREPALLATGAGLMVLVGLAAAWGPARRAVHVAPAVALRES